MSKAVRMLPPPVALERPRGGQSQSRKAEQAVAGLLRGGTIAQAAAHAGISEGTLKDWLKSAWFQALYQDAKNRLLEGTINRMRTLGEKALRTLEEVMDDEQSPPAARVTAGRALLDLMLKAIETQELAARLDKLEQSLEHMNED